MTTLAMTEVEKQTNYRCFIEANGWTETPDGWVRSGTFCKTLSLEGAFHLEHIIMEIDQEDTSA